MNWLEKIVDACFEKMKAEKYPMMTPSTKIPQKMVDKTIEPEDDWRGWQPINSTVTDEMLNKLESDIKFKFPLSYRYFLQYKHFYDLQLADVVVRFPANLPDKNLTWLNERIFKTFESEEIIGKGYFYFADFDDFGLLCFDLNNINADGECKIVFIDHEDLDDVLPYANSFKDLLSNNANYSNEFIKILNEHHSKK